MDMKTAAAKSKKCAHAQCNCPVERVGEYCGAYCEGLTPKSTAECKCDHDGCQH